MIRIALLVAFIVVGFPALGRAECISLSVATVARHADAIFSGTITDIADWTITFEVDRVWKGPVTKQFTLHLVPSVDQFQPISGARYLAFAHHASGNEAFGAKERRPFVIRPCGGGARRWELVSPREIKELGRGRNPSRNQPSLPLVAALSPEDLELWRVALDQIQIEQPSLVGDFVLLNQSILANQIRPYLQARHLTDPLFERLLQRNDVSVRFPGSLKLPPFRVLDVSRFRDTQDWDKWRRTQQRSHGPTWNVSVSLPVFANEGTRAIVYTVAFAGPGAARGTGFIFEKIDGRWMVWERFAGWIS